MPRRKNAGGSAKKHRGRAKETLPVLHPYVLMLDKPLWNGHIFNRASSWEAPGKHVGGLVVRPICQ
jgi:hypothetical protein